MQLVRHSILEKIFSAGTDTKHTNAGEENYDEVEAIAPHTKVKSQEESEIEQLLLAKWISDNFDKHILPIASMNSWSQGWPEFEEHHPEVRCLPDTLVVTLLP